MKNISSNKIVSLGTCIVLILISLSLCFSQYQEFLLVEEQSVKTVEKIMKLEKKYMRDILKENIDKSNKILELKNQQIQYELVEKYTCDKKLISDILYPNDDCILSQTLDKQLFDLYINKDNKNNRAFVVSTNNIVWNRTDNTSNNENKATLSWEDFNSFKYNNELAIEAVNNIKSVKYNTTNLIFWQSSSSEHKINEMNLGSLYDLYKQYGLEDLKNYELLVPSYITNTGDIFGTSDVSSNGIQNDNYKLVIIQRINIFDALSPYEKNFNEYTEEISNINAELYRVSLNKVKIIFECIIILIIVFCLSALLQNKVLLNKTTDSIKK